MVGPIEFLKKTPCYKVTGFKVKVDSNVRLSTPFVSADTSREVLEGVLRTHKHGESKQVTLRSALGVGTEGGTHSTRMKNTAPTEKVFVVTTETPSPQDGFPKPGNTKEKPSKAAKAPSVFSRRAQHRKKASPRDKDEENVEWDTRGVPSSSHCPDGDDGVDEREEKSSEQGEAPRKEVCGATPRRARVMSGRAARPLGMTMQERMRGVETKGRTTRRRRTKKGRASRRRKIREMRKKELRTEARTKAETRTTTRKKAVEKWTGTSKLLAHKHPRTRANEKCRVSDVERRYLVWARLTPHTCNIWKDNRGNPKKRGVSGPRKRPQEIYVDCIKVLPNPVGGPVQYNVRPLNEMLVVSIVRAMELPEKKGEWDRATWILAPVTEVAIRGRVAAHKCKCAAHDVGCKERSHYVSSDMLGIVRGAATIGGVTRAVKKLNCRLAVLDLCPRKSTAPHEWSDERFAVLPEMMNTFCGTDWVIVIFSTLRVEQTVLKNVLRWDHVKVIPAPKTPKDIGYMHRKVIVIQHLQGYHEAKNSAIEIFIARCERLWFNKQEDGLRVKTYADELDAGEHFDVLDSEEETSDEDVDLRVPGAQQDVRQALDGGKGQHAMERIKTDVVASRESIRGGEQRSCEQGMQESAGNEIRGPIGATNASKNNSNEGLHAGAASLSGKEPHLQSKRKESSARYPGVLTQLDNVYVSMGLSKIPREKQYNVPQEENAQWQLRKRVLKSKFFEIAKEQVHIKVRQANGGSENLAEGAYADALYDKLRDQNMLEYNAKFNDIESSVLHGRIPWKLPSQEVVQEFEGEICFGNSVLVTVSNWDMTVAMLPRVQRDVHSRAPSKKLKVVQMVGPIEFLKKTPCYKVTGFKVKVDSNVRLSTPFVSADTSREVLEGVLRTHKHGESKQVTLRSALGVGTEGGTHSTRMKNTAPTEKVFVVTTETPSPQDGFPKPGNTKEKPSKAAKAPSVFSRRAQHRKKASPRDKDEENVEWDTRGVPSSSHCPDGDDGVDEREEKSSEQGEAPRKEVCGATPRRARVMSGRAARPLGMTMQERMRGVETKGRTTRRRRTKKGRASRRRKIREMRKKELRTEARTKAETRTTTRKKAVEKWTGTSKLLAHKHPRTRANEKCRVSDVERRYLVWARLTPHTCNIWKDNRGNPKKRGVSGPRKRPQEIYVDCIKVLPNPVGGPVQYNVRPLNEMLVVSIVRAMELPEKKGEWDRATWILAPVTEVAIRGRVAAHKCKCAAHDVGCKERSHYVSSDMLGIVRGAATIGGVTRAVKKLNCRLAVLDLCPRKSTAPHEWSDERFAVLPEMMNTFCGTDWVIVIFSTLRVEQTVLKNVLRWDHVKVIPAPKTPKDIGYMHRKVIVIQHLQGYHEAKNSAIEIFIARCERLWFNKQEDGLRVKTYADELDAGEHFDVLDSEEETSDEDVDLRVPGAQQDVRQALDGGKGQHAMERIKTDVVASRESIRGGEQRSCEQGMQESAGNEIRGPIGATNASKNNSNEGLHAGAASLSGKEPHLQSKRKESSARYPGVLTQLDNVYVSMGLSKIPREKQYNVPQEENAQWQLRKRVLKSKFFEIAKEQVHIKVRQANGGSENLAEGAYADALYDKLRDQNMLEYNAKFNDIESSVLHGRIPWKLPSQEVVQEFEGEICFGNSVLVTVSNWDMTVAMLPRVQRDVHSRAPFIVTRKLMRGMI
ncbi:hypothetical protein CBR_g22221 [Chara braunii]|uniref:Uncharacterized protein n=1 Tax=Chara braunii TaxID=69332 RepID=A0A388L2E1_CHABU|nr:hypothetical protein CBR_g22221 [Chara braunii]|eukprot:GBG76475.1 hypothetical protein CBR_g22221 [Chara braunii]